MTNVDFISKIQKKNIFDDEKRTRGSPKYIPMIKARKRILLLGNHDARGAYKDLFSEIYAGPLFISDKILLSHEPVYGLNWCLNIHGHDHSGIEAYKDGCKHINLAANVCGYTPINLGKIIFLFDVNYIPQKKCQNVEFSARG